VGVYRLAYIAFNYKAIVHSILIFTLLYLSNNLSALKACDAVFFIQFAERRRERHNKADRLNIKTKLFYLSVICY
jgi:hypothetical protein